jgi:hypothetical protein
MQHAVWRMQQRAVAIKAREAIDPLHAESRPNTSFLHGVTERARTLRQCSATTFTQPWFTAKPHTNKDCKPHLSSALVEQVGDAVREGTQVLRTLLFRQLPRSTHQLTNIFVFVREAGPISLRSEVVVARDGSEGRKRFLLTADSAIRHYAALQLPSSKLTNKLAQALAAVVVSTR